MTESELLQANLDALGVKLGAVGQRTEDRVFEALKKRMVGTGQLVSTREVADEAGISQSAAAFHMKKMLKSGRVLSTINPSNGKLCYVPVVVEDAQA